jgi:SAM-dependent methyltransferase
VVSGSQEFDREYYEKNYGSYERQNPPRKMEFYRSLLERHARRGGRILDVGCAFGTFLGSLGPEWERFGSDVSEYAIERAKRAVPGAVFRVAGAADPGFEGPFDAITAFDVIEHAPDLDAVGSALKSRMAPRGRLVFVVPVYDGPAGLLVRWLDRDPTHLHKRSRRFWLEWASSRFGLLEWQGVVRYLLPGGHYVHLPTRALRAVAPAIAIVAGA